MRGRLAICILVSPLVFTHAAALTLEDGASVAMVASGLDMPVDVVVAPDGAIYYAELMTGRLRVIPQGASAPEPEAVWTAPDLQTGAERGFVGLALDPEFATTRAFYVFYTRNVSGEITNRVSKVVDGVETVLLDGLRAGPLHNSGRMAFLPDGTLLVSAGDATLDTVGPDKARHAHDPTDLSGKVLRIHRDGSIPADNPWGNAVWTKGHRNVYGLAVSPEGTVLGTENGPDCCDEVNLLVAGNDYGWPTCKGACGNAEYADPLFEYSPTIAPTGATWFDGHFYFSDFNSGRVHRLRELPNGSWSDERVMRLDTPRVLDVAAGSDALYFATWETIERLSIDPRWRTEAPPAPTVEAPPVTTTPEEALPNDAGSSRVPAVSPLAALGALLVVAALLRPPRDR